MAEPKIPQGKFYRENSRMRNLRRTLAKTKSHAVRITILKEMLQEFQKRANRARNMRDRAKEAAKRMVRKAAGRSRQTTRQARTWSGRKIKSGYQRGTNRAGDGMERVAQTRVVGRIRDRYTERAVNRDSNRQARQANRTQRQQFRQQARQVIRAQRQQARLANRAQQPQAQANRAQQPQARQQSRQAPKLAPRVNSETPQQKAARTRAANRTAPSAPSAPSAPGRSRTAGVAPGLSGSVPPLRLRTPSTKEGRLAAGQAQSRTPAAPPMPSDSVGRSSRTSKTAPSEPAGVAQKPKLRRSSLSKRS